MSDRVPTWLTVRITETDAAGVDSRLLSRLLIELSDSMLAAARYALGDRRKRRGPATTDESKLAGLRMTSLSQGSVVLEYSRPIGLGNPIPTLPGLETTQIDPESVAVMVMKAAEESSDGSEIEPGTEPLRRSVRRFLETASKVGSSCEFRLAAPHAESRRVEIALRALQPDATIPADQRDISLYGHVYMADVELGRQRLRIKLPNDADVTMEIVPELRESLLELLDKPVVLDVTESLRKGFVVSRTVRDARVLPDRLGGEEHPPKSLLELAAAQGLLSQPVPDYGRLASEIWLTPDEVEQASSYFRELRMASA